MLKTPTSNDRIILIKHQL